MRGRFIALGILALSACGPGPSPSGTASPVPEADQVRFTGLMERNDIEFSGLQAEAAHHAGRERSLARLRAIKASIPEAMALQVRTSDSERAELKREFTVFLKLLEELERDEWSDSSALPAFKRLEQGCNHCHVKFK